MKRVLIVLTDTQHRILKQQKGNETWELTLIVGCQTLHKEKQARKNRIEHPI